ncbi:MAG: DoxX family protein [Muribaculaceae bacterium]|nr:DoxX family protein [Muribaculaceae bacterium]
MLKRLFLYSAGHTYSNLSRLFLRMFTSVMFLQLCVRQLLHIDQVAPAFEGLMGLSPETSVTVLLVVESLCAVCVMVGLLMRLALIPPIVIMGLAEWELLTLTAGQANGILSFQPGYPMMFLGIFIYLMLAGPGKISLDYVIGVHLIDTREDDQVLDKA